MFRTAASITALSVGLIVSGSALAGHTTPAASQAEYKAMQNATMAASDIKDRSLEGRGPVEQGAKPTEPKDERMFDYPHSPAPGDEAYGERGDPGVAEQKVFDYPERPAPGDKAYGERGDPGVADRQTADYPQRPAPGDVPYEARGSSIDEDPEQAYAPTMERNLDETQEGPVTGHLPNENM